MNACHDFWNYQPVDPVLCGNYSTIPHNFEADMAAIYIICFFKLLLLLGSLLLGDAGILSYPE